METEIWPNTLLACGQRGIHTFLVNGDLSERSSRNYATLRPLFAGPLGNVRAFLVQTEEDARRYRRIVGPDARIEVTGNVKFDNLPKPLSTEERTERRAQFGASPGDVVILAGSTHPTEERTVWDAFVKARAELPNVRLVICPRHPERFTSVADELTELGAKVHRLSLPQHSDPRLCDVVLIDQMGTLGSSFGAADIGIVGGAWNPIGGHNLLEPASHGIPVLHGPHMHEQREIMRIMLEHHASLEASRSDLGQKLFALASNPKERDVMGKRGQTAASENAGAATRSVVLIESLK